MKTTIQNPEKGLPSRPDQVGTASNPQPSSLNPQPSAGTESRSDDLLPLRAGERAGVRCSESSQPSTLNSQPPIDFARRRANRQLRTQDLLALLRTEAPRFYELAEVVGKWVWIQFTDKQPPEVTRVLAELGFHWNNKRQVWQHPCGDSALRTPQPGIPQDPRAKYGSFHAADAQPI
jgi:hypothetical protein